MAEENKRIIVNVCGRVLGTASGWDQADTWAIFFSDFEPSAVKGLSAGTLLVDFDNGKISIVNDDGTTEWENDLIEVLWQIERA